MRLSYCTSLYLVAIFLILGFSVTKEETLSLNPGHRNSTQEPGRRHFVLVHGAAHGAWCWYKVSSLLKAAGHRVTALDLKASGANPTNLDAVTSLLDYSGPLLKFIGSLPPGERVVLVGHSLGGSSISIAMELHPRKISVGVFLAAVMPLLSSLNRSSEMSKQKSLKRKEETVPQPNMKYYYGNGPVRPATGLFFTPEFYKTVYYRLSPAEDYELGMALWRYWPCKAEDKNEVNLTEMNYGRVRRVFVVCDPETAVDWQTAYIKGFPPEEVVTLEGSDHMAMFSKTKSLVATLENIGAKYY